MATHSPQAITALAPSSTTVNTPSILTSASPDPLAANPAREAWSIQNLGTNPLYVRLGTGCSTTVFNYLLKAGASQDDGSSPPFSDEVWKGVVSVAGTSPRYVITEVT